MPLLGSKDLMCPYKKMSKKYLVGLVEEMIVLNKLNFQKHNIELASNWLIFKDTSLALGMK